jgi:hypothetical protein
MTNNKQQTAVEWFANQLNRVVSNTTDALSHNYKELLEQAKEMEEEKLDVAYGNGYEQGEMDFYKKMRGKEMSYDDGYADGYKRAVELMEWCIKNYIKPNTDHIGKANKTMGEQ